MPTNNHILDITTLENWLWEAACSIRGPLDAPKYKDYILPLLFYKLIQVRWPHGPKCPHCGERDLQYLKLIDPDYREGLGRWKCLVCAEAGNPDDGGTFTPLTGTILDGMRIDVRTLWLIVEMFADGKASVETSDEACVNHHTTDRLFRLFRAAIYQTRSVEPIVLSVEDIAEFDEVYITAGLKLHLSLSLPCWLSTPGGQPRCWRVCSRPGW